MYEDHFDDFQISISESDLPAFLKEKLFSEDSFSLLVDSIANKNIPTEPTEPTERAEIKGELSKNGKKIKIVADRLLSNFNKFSQVYNSNKTPLDKEAYQAFVDGYKNMGKGSEFVGGGVDELETIDIIRDIKYSKKDAKQAVKYYTELYLALSSN